MSRPANLDNPSPLTELSLWGLLAVLIVGVILFGLSISAPTSSPGPQPLDENRARALAGELIEIRRLLGADRAERVGDLTSDAEALAKADAHLQRVEAEYPAQAQVHFHRGLERLAVGDNPAAAVALERSLELDETSLAAYLTLSAVYGEEGNFVAAEKVLRRALELQPKAFALWDNLGQVLWLQGREDEAKEAYRHRLQLEGKPLVESGPV